MQIYLKWHLVSYHLSYKINDKWKNWMEFSQKYKAANKTYQKDSISYKNQKKVGKGKNGKGKYQSVALP